MCMDYSSHCAQGSSHSWLKNWDGCETHSQFSLSSDLSKGAGKSLLRVLVFVQKLFCCIGEPRNHALIDLTKGLTGPLPYKPDPNTKIRSCPKSLLRFNAHFFTWLPFQLHKAGGVKD